MQVSEARIRANRLNATRSTGPRTDSGKSIARRNSLKAGLSGKTTVTPEGVAEEIARRVESLSAEMRPQTSAGASFLLQMAICAVRMERAVDHENAATAYRVRHAIDAFDEQRIEAANILFDKLADQPRSALRQLRKSPEGLDRLLDAWEDLRADLTVNAWGDDQVGQAVALTGLQARHACGTLFAAMTRAIRGDFGALDRSEGSGLDDQARQAWAKSRLFELIDEQIAALEAHLETLDLDMIDLDRAEAPGRALFDDSKAACLARRYESEASRGFFRALREFRKVEAEFAVQATSAPSPAPKSSPAPASAPIPRSSPSRMGSFRETPPSPDRPPVRTAPASISSEIPVVRDASGQPLSIGRPLQTSR